MFAVLGSVTFAQTYQDYFPVSTSLDDGYYSEADDSYYFPDDYYYEYPDDYYTEDFYKSSYNDYQRSISDVNWERFFYENRLSNYQIQQIMDLNRMYDSYFMWNQYYRFNPDRWYYDRFYSLRNILGPRVFVVFQNSYYGGYSPFVYYRNYRMRHYTPVVYVMPRYRHININRYKVDRVKFHQNNGYNHNTRPNIGLNSSTRSGANGNGGFRPTENNGGRRGDSIRETRGQNSGFRGEGTKTPTRNTVSPRDQREKSRPSNNGGFRNSTSSRSESSPRGGSQGGSTRTSNEGGFRIAKR